MSTTTRSGRTIIKPERYTPIEKVLDDYSDSESFSESDPDLDPDDCSIVSSDDDNEEDDGNEQPRSGDWGGSEKDPFHKDRPNDDKVQKRHRSFGKREFKGGSPLAQSKGSTVVAHEGMLTQLKKKFPKKSSTLLSEDNIIEE